jgi:hypothetical protein
MEIRSYSPFPIPLKTFIARERHDFEKSHGERTLFKPKIRSGRDTQVIGRMRRPVKFLEYLMPTGIKAQNERSRRVKKNAPLPDESIGAPNWR